MLLDKQHCLEFLYTKLEALSHSQEITIHVCLAVGAPSGDVAAP